MNLSARANAYWSYLGRSASDDQLSAVEHFFQSNDLPCAAPFIECLARVGGLTLDVPNDSICFFSAADLVRLAKISIKASFFGDANGDWYYACDSWYPGTIFLHRSGSFHYERDLNEKWANSLGDIIESAALLWSVGKRTLKFRLNGFFAAPSLSMLGIRLNGGPDPHSSSMFQAYYCYRGGIVTAHRVHEFNRKGGCGITAILPTREAVLSLERDLTGLLSTVLVKPVTD